MLFIALAVFSSCAREERALVDEDDAAGADAVSVELAVSVAGVQTTGTKSSITSITELADLPSFRGMRNIVFFPFAGNKTIKMSDRVLNGNVPLADISNSTDYKAVDGMTWHTGLIDNNHSHLYGGIMLPKATGSALVYGQAAHAGSDDEDSAASKKLNGSMLVSGLSTEQPVRYPSSISFAPEPIYPTAGTPAAATSLVNLLNQIAGCSVTITINYRKSNKWYTVDVPFTWDSSLDDTGLVNIYNEFISSGNMLGGSGSSVAALLTNLYRALKAYNNTDTSIVSYSGYTCYKDKSSYNNSNRLTFGYLYNQVRDLICAQIEGLSALRYTGSGTSATFSFSDAALANYPTSLGLPPGCAAIRWNGSAFTVVDNADPVNGMAERSSYCYPPSLWYFTNSAIKTSIKDDERDQYVFSNTTWGSILAEYIDAPVSSNTQSVAVVEPLRYAPALLEVTILAQSATLADNDNDNATNVTVGTTNFPLTGLLIGGQRVQKFNFTPSITGEETVYSLYDTNVRSASNAQVYLKTTASAAVRSLAFPTPDDADITVALEFLNNSGERFFGAGQQLIPAGGTFYLIGSLKISNKDEAARTVGGKVLNSVFTQAYKTTVHFTVSSMKDAVNTIPDLKEPQLALGVSADLDWKEVTPQNLPLY